MVEQPPIAVTFIHEVNDHVQAHRLLYRQSFLFKADKVVAVLLAGFGVYLVSVVGVRWWSVLFFGLAVVEWFDLLGLLRTRLLFGRNPKYREAYHLTFSPQNIHFKTASIDSTLQWTHYHRLVENSQLFLLMYGKGLYTLIPKRCFRSAAEVEAFRALLRAKVAQQDP